MDDQLSLVDSHKLMISDFRTYKWKIKILKKVNDFLQVGSSKGSNGNNSRPNC